MTSPFEAASNLPDKSLPVSSRAFHKYLGIVSLESNLKLATNTRSHWPRDLSPLRGSIPFRIPHPRLAPWAMILSRLRRLRGLEVRAPECRRDAGAALGRGVVSVCSAGSPARISRRE